jgi:hypothetical protein
MSLARDSTVEWLLAGDPSIRWHVMRDLLQASPEQVARERHRVADAGWGHRLLALQGRDGRWDKGLYTPKWTSTTYTLLLLRSLGLETANRRARRGAELLLDAGLYIDGGINLWLPRRKCSETCVTGMVLGSAARFAPDDARVNRLAAHLCAEQMQDGGWNCQRCRGATHSSMHTTISVLEALLEYEQAKGRLGADTCAARERAHEFLFRHRLFRSHRTGEVIDGCMTRFSFPPQWHYDVLRALDYLQAAGARRDSRLQEGIEIVERRRSQNGTWLLQNFYRGRYHFVMEEPGAPSRWNTLRALRVLRWWHDLAPPEPSGRVNAIPQSPRTR